MKADCGCTKADYPKKSVAPGERFTIALTYDARQLGHFTKQVGVYSNATSQPLYLKMKGVVLTEVHDYSKTHPYDFGGLRTDVDNLEFDDVNKGDTRQIEMHLVNDTETPITPNMLHLPPYLTATCTPEKLLPGKSGTMVVTLHSEHIDDYGLTQAPVYLAKQLGEKVNSDIEMPVSVVVLPNMSAFEGLSKNAMPCLQLSSEQLSLGLLDGKMVKSGTIDIANTGRSTLQISSLQLFTGGMKVTLGKRTLQAGETTRLKVTIDRDELLRQRTKPRVLMITNDPRHAKVAININIR